MEKICRVFDMGYKEVIDLRDGARLGYVGDVEIDLETGGVRSLVIPGRLRLFGLLGREEERVVPWADIEKIGEDIILVRTETPEPARRPAGRGKLRGK